MNPRPWTSFGGAFAGVTSFIHSLGSSLPIIVRRLRGKFPLTASRGRVRGEIFL